MSYPINVPLKKTNKHSVEVERQLLVKNYQMSFSGGFPSSESRSHTSSPNGSSGDMIETTINALSNPYFEFGKSQPHRLSISSPHQSSNEVVGLSHLSLLGPETHNHVFNVHSVVKNRNGSVLGRKTILKSEHVDSTIRPQVDFYLQGAPNFRSGDPSIYGVAQPTISGLSTILTLLKCQSAYKNQRACLWFSAREEPMLYINGRPFVLRDEDEPFQNIRRYQGINSTRIEQMEDRLKKDVLEEVEKGDGLILVHDEIENGRLIPTWTAVDNVETQKEVFADLKVKGFNITYYRIPISPEQAPDDKYIDEYYQVIKKTPIEDAMIFNCGMGVGRTTFAMVLAIITRTTLSNSCNLSRKHYSEMDDLHSLEEADMKNRALLRLVYVLEKGLMGHGVSHSAIDWALARCPIIDDLRNAVLGNYQFILQLTSVISDGSKIKRIVDEAINKCDRLINLREEILKYRISYSVTGNVEFLQKSLGFLERYSFLLIFCAFIHEKAVDQSIQSFQEWIKSRPEMLRMLENLRKKGPRLHLFRPVEDLSLFSNTLNETSSPGYSGKNRATELEKYVIKGRQGAVLVPHTILKLDQWSQNVDTVPGAANFRKIPGMDVYGTAQPAIEGVANVIKVLKGKRIVWINLREEPLIYVNGSPYVLRDKYFTLRNIKSYSGITDTRLEYLEEKLKIDVLKEVLNYDDKILLHGETLEGEITPIWEDVFSANILTMREIMDNFKNEGANLDYYRAPVTAETPPEEPDFDHLLSIISRQNLKETAIVLNCQVGNGRSTTGTVVTCLVLYWLNGGQKRRNCGTEITSPLAKETKVTYQIIHSLLRVIKDGLECKRIVDETIDACSHSINLRTSIEMCRNDAERDVDDEVLLKKTVRKGILNLKRYFLLIVFQSYLNDTNPETINELITFQAWVSNRPEIELMRKELDHGTLDSLIPVEQMRPGDGIALTSEVLNVVNSRNGGVLASQTILKYDMFPGCQKMNLSEKIEGAPNYRKVSLLDVGISPLSKEFSNACNSPSVYGIAMPTVEAIRTVALKVGAEIGGKRKLLWTSLREEPVIYVNGVYLYEQSNSIGRPYVLRLFQDPLKNLEATGIARERVEEMEEQMKRDVIAELERYNGRILLHEEMADGKHFSIIPVWETASNKDVMTPLDVYNQIKSEGYQVDYLRIPITDEQAPIPTVFDELVGRMSHFGRLETSSVIDSLFNCQMGRGRTTTGMVIACLMHMIVGNTNIENLMPTSIERIESQIVRSTSSAEFEERRYKKGEFKIILQLIAVLQHGKLSKKLTDSAIDSCEHLQNLRVAVYDYKLQIEACEFGSKKFESVLKVGLNYLVRYFYLITFADYLIEVFGGEIIEPTISFCAWLHERQEILNIVRTSNQSLD